MFVLTFPRTCITFLTQFLVSYGFKISHLRIVSPKGTLHFGPNMTCRNAAFISLTARTRWFVPRAKFQGFASKTRDLNLKILLYIYIHYQA